MAKIEMTVEGERRLITFEVDPSLINSEPDGLFSALGDLELNDGQYEIVVSDSEPGLLPHIHVIAKESDSATVHQPARHDPLTDVETR